jgi:hypothetical protein
MVGGDRATHTDHRHRGRANGPAGGGTGTALAGFFTNIETVATLSNRAGIHNQEWGGHTYLCTGPTMPWAQLWPLLRHYGLPPARCGHIIATPEQGDMHPPRPGPTGTSRRPDSAIRTVPGLESGDSPY